VPVVRRAGVVPIDRTDEGAFLDPGHVRWVASREEAVWAVLRVQLDESALLNHEVGQPVPLGDTSVTPDHGVRLSERGDVLYPGNDAFVGSVRGRGEERRRWCDAHGALPS
jgi:hypothetical protein